MQATKCANEHEAFFRSQTRCRFASICIWIGKISCDFIIIIIIILLNLVAWFKLRKLKVRFASTPLHKKVLLTLKIRKPIEVVMQEIRRNGILSSDGLRSIFHACLQNLKIGNGKCGERSLEALAVAVCFGKHKNHMGYDDNCVCL